MVEFDSRYFKLLHKKLIEPGHLLPVDFDEVFTGNTLGTILLLHTGSHNVHLNRIKSIVFS